MKQPGLVESYLRAQDMRYGTHDTYGDPTPEIPTPNEPLHPNRHLGRNVLIGLAATAAVVVPVQYFRETPETRSGQENTAVIPSGEAKGDDDKIQPSSEPTAEDVEQHPGNPEDLTFAALFGQERLKLGTLYMNTDGQGQINFAESKKKSGTIALPNMTHTQDVELYAQPLLLEDGTYTLPITATARQDGQFLVTYDRSKLVILPDVAMTGTYKLSRDTTSKITTIAYTGEDTNDSFSLSFLAPNSAAIKDTTKKISDETEKGIVGMIADGASDKIAQTGAQIISLKLSDNYTKTIAANQCFANAADTNPGEVLKLAQQVMDDRVIEQLNQWSTANDREIIIQIVGEYPADYATIQKQTTAYISASSDEKAKAFSRDTLVATSHPNAKYFDITTKKIVCMPDEQLTSGDR